MIEKRQLFPESKSTNLLKQIAPAPQKFVINLKADTSITCKNGTIISFPKDCFIDKNGIMINKNITIEVVEALTLTDFLHYGLQTVSDGKLLQSGGMIYIDAKSNNQPLALKDSSSLFVEFPSNFKEPGMKLFTGVYDSTGNINWIENPNMKQGLIPLPLSEFDYKYYTKYEVNKSRTSLRYLDSIILNTNKRYENTFLATIEFEERFNALNKYCRGWGYAVFGRYKILEDVAPETTYLLEYTMLDIYLKNIDKPLWIADSIVYSFVKSNALSDSINHHWHSYFGKKFTSEIFRNFYKERLTNVFPFDSKGVDLSTHNAKELLIQKGYSGQQAYEHILIYNVRERLIKQRQEKTRIKKEKQEFETKAENVFMTAIKVTKLGWTNVDRFFDDPDAKEVELFVQTICDSVDFCDLTLVFPHRNIAIKGMLMSNGKYRFTTDDKQYQKLPIDEEGIIIAMSSKNNQPYFAIQPLTIKEKQLITMNIQKSTWKELEAGLKKLQ